MMLELCLGIVAIDDPKAYGGHVIRFIRDWASAGKAGLALLLLLLWGTGRVMTDRHEWSQWVWWIPSPLLLGVACVLAAWAMASGRRRRRARWVRRAAGAASMLGVLYLLLVEWRYGVGMLGIGGPAAQDSLRVVFWNPSLPRGGGVADRVLAASPDVAIIANPPLRDEGLSLDDLDRAMGPGAMTLSAGNVLVATRAPVLRWGVTTLGLEGRVARVGYSGEGPDHWIDPGHAAFVELDASGTLGRTIVVWIVDLPSDLSLVRHEVTKQAADVIAGFDGPVWSRDAEGRFVSAGARGERGFPRADVLIGDFNIPRGSHSLRALTGGLRDAYALAGMGPMGTWPRSGALHHLDQAFVGEGIGVGRYAVRDPGIGLHRMIIVELTGQD